MPKSTDAVSEWERRRITLREYDSHARHAPAPPWQLPGWVVGTLWWQRKRLWAFLRWKASRP